VKHRVAKVFLFSCLALSGARVFALSLEMPRRAAVKAALGPPSAQEPKTQTTVATAKTLKPLAAAASIAGSSALMLADGIDAHSSLVQVQSPAAGFAYER
jgi:hypothetical protein